MNILILGANGQLGWELGSALSPLGRVISLGRKEADLSRLDQLEKKVRETRAEVIVNAAAYTAVDQAERESELAAVVNSQAPALLARLAKECRAWLLHYSTDYVYDGRKGAPYQESDPPSPLNVYGQTKLAGDQAVASSGCRHLIFRTGWVFSETGRNFPRTILNLAASEKSLSVVADQIGSPTSAAMLAGASALALQSALASGKDLSGLYHLASGGHTSWHGLAVYLVERARLLGWPLAVKAEDIRATATDAKARPALRPADSRLSTEKFQKTFQLTPPPWAYYIDRLLLTWAKTGINLRKTP